jgi:hypothetical protein
VKPKADRNALARHERDCPPYIGVKCPLCGVRLPVRLGGRP